MEVPQDTSSALREMDSVCYGLVCLLSWGRSYGEWVARPGRIVSKVPMPESSSLPGALLAGFWSKLQQKFPSESWLSPTSMVIRDIKILKSGGSGITWRGWCRRDGLVTQLCRVGPEAFPPKRWHLHPCASPSGEEVVVQLPGVQITGTTAGASGLPHTPHTCWGQTAKYWWLILEVKKNVCSPNFIFESNFWVFHWFSIFRLDKKAYVIALCVFVCLYLPFP